MKCEELIAYNVVATADVNPEVVDSLGCTEWTGYDKNDVDAAITELKARIHELESIPHTDNSAVIERLSNENERLKAKLESVQATAYAESVDAGMEDRKLKRALWMARATIANSTRYKYHRLACKAEMDPKPHGWSCYINGEVYRTGKMNRMLEPYYWIEIWEEVERKCLAKAKEYK